MNLLIVDDESIEIEALERILRNTGREDITTFKASNVRQARTIFQQNEIDVLLCDIEMPQETGLELLAWTGKNSPGTESVLITCHADFSYAKEALKLGSLDYLLKPVQPEELMKAVGKAEKKLNEKKEEIVQKHRSELWRQHKPHIAEYIWQEIINGRMQAELPEVERFLSEINLQNSGAEVFPIVIRIDDRDILDKMGTARKMIRVIKRNASALFLKNPSAGTIFEAEPDVLVLLLFTENTDVKNRENIDEKSRKLISILKKHYGYVVSCFYRRGCTIDLLEKEYKFIMAASKKNTDKECTIIMNLDSDASVPFSFPDMVQIEKALEKQDISVIKHEIYHLIKELSRNADLTAYKLNQVQMDYIQILSFFLKSKGVLIHQLNQQLLISSGLGNSGDALAELEQWMSSYAEKALDIIQTSRNRHSVIEKIRHYFGEHMAEGLNCEDLAEYVMLNPVYLNRIFKKETGKSFSEFLQNERLNRAKLLLKNQNLTVADVALDVGYTSFSYFSRMFRKFTGVSPNQYRKML